MGLWFRIVYNKKRLQLKQNHNSNDVSVPACNGNKSISHGIQDRCNSDTVINANIEEYNDASDSYRN